MGRRRSGGSPPQGRRFRRCDGGFGNDAPSHAEGGAKWNGKVVVVVKVVNHRGPARNQGGKRKGATINTVVQDMLPQPAATAPVKRRATPKERKAISKAHTNGAHRPDIGEWLV